MVPVAGDYAIQTEGLRKSYGDVHALQGVDLYAAPGTVLGLLGPNGAGKTTAVRILTTLLKPDGGSARVAGLDVVARRERAALADRARGPERRGRREPHGFENLEMVGRLYHLGKRESRKRARRAARALRPRRRRRAASCARTRAACAAGSTSRRRSSPARPCSSSTSRPPASTRAAGSGCGRSSRAASSEGTTVLLTTQYLDEADRLSDQIAVIDHGKVIAEGTSDELKARVGGERLEVTVADEADAPRASDVLCDACAEPPVVEGRA